MIEIKDLSLGYDGKILLEHVNARIPSGTLIALIGRNGTGKSTLLRCLAGLNRNYSGTVGIDGTDILNMNNNRIAKTISIVTTERVRLRGLKCEEVVALGRAPYSDWIGSMDADGRSKVRKALLDTDMEDYASRSMDTMSDGECQRIMVARALAQDTPVMLLDEPTAFLDMPGRYELCELLRRVALEGDGKTVVFSTHELDLAVRMCDYVALIHEKDLLMYRSLDLQGIEVMELFRNPRLFPLFS